MSSFSISLKIKRDVPVSLGLIVILPCYQSGTKESHEMLARALPTSLQGENVQQHVNEGARKGKGGCMGK